MNYITIKINKAYVFDAVDETTAYLGAKAIGDDTAYSRVATVDADRTLLENFWTEACSLATSNFKQFLSSISENRVSHTIDITANYEVTISISTQYDNNLTSSIEASLFEFFTNYIVGKWCELTNKTEAEKYLTTATGMMKDVMSNIYYRKRPKRPNIE